MSCMLTLADISSDTWSEDVVEERKILGRSESCEIRLDHASISRQHCAVWQEGDDCWIQDCGSTNGTYLNGIRVQKERIRPGDMIVVGRFELFVEDRNLLQATMALSESPTSPPAVQGTQSEEQRLAAIIHQRLTPSRRMSLPGMIVDVVYQPSGILGGDCFEAFELESRWILSIFDPMTHGVKAALNTILLRSELQRWVMLTAQPGRCLQWINSELTQLGVNDLYISAVVAEWFPTTQTLVYSAAGVHPPLIVRDGAVINLGETAGGLPLGVAVGEHYFEHLAQLKRGDRVFFFTDGVGETFTAEDSGTVSTAVELGKRVMATHRLPLSEQIRTVLHLTNPRQEDDVLLVGCEIT
ncbi:MAG: SpoIIE family protein phosphatase [Planctomycetes bacterium]|nr:SpoIIE family protein phosphatase [Planctomycetota bacterium]